MLKRHAFIIESSNVTGQKDLPGARIDLKSWVGYLTSNLGGAWYNSEIKTYSKPKWTVLKADLAAVRSGEYAFVAFSGHGYHAKSGVLNESAIVLNETEDILVKSMVTQGSWQLMCFDSCRGVESTLPPELILESFAARAAAASPDAYRRYFDEMVEQADRMCSITYACDVKEGAAEDKTRGGIYTASMHESGREWHKGQSGRGCLSILSGHQSAAQKVTKERAQQHPQEELGRSRRYLPFAVKA